MSEAKILLVDDENEFCVAVKKNLEIMGNFKVFIANNGKEGLSLAESIRPDVIILDIMMPGIDGFEVLKKIKTNKNTIAIPVIMLTARGDEASKIKAARLYDEAYLTKPIEANDLKSKIEEVLKIRGSK